MTYYGIAVLLAAGWYGLLGLLGTAFKDFPGGVHMIGAALVCGGLVAARLSRGFLGRTRGGEALVAAVIAVVLGWVCSLVFYAVFFDLIPFFRGSELPSFSSLFLKVGFGAGISLWGVIQLWPAAIPALIASVAVTCVAARELR